MNKKQNENSLFLTCTYFDHYHVSAVNWLTKDSYQLSHNDGDDNWRTFKTCHNITNQEIFQQDAAPIHISQENMDYFLRENVLDWSALCPDLNIVENIW